MSIHARSVLLAALVALFALGAVCQPNPNKPARLDPLRLYSIGDSITRAFDAQFIADNPALSWVNGYHGVNEANLGLPDIHSINQRIYEVYGPVGRTNVIAAVNGARWDDGVSQAANVVVELPTFVTVMLGGNDVCRDTAADLPTDMELRGHVRATLESLDAALPAGATVQVVGIPDIKDLYDVGKDETGLFGLDCEAIWTLTLLGFPCGSMLSPGNSEADRLYVQQRNTTYNQIIRQETLAQDTISPRVYYRYSDAQQIAITGPMISPIDCFHPSALGEALISELAWEDGPFTP